MDERALLTVVGLIFDIFGASLLAFGVLTKSTYFVASQNLKKEDLERIKIIKQSCDDFKNSLLGLSLLCLGFILQILAQTPIVFSSDIFIISVIVCWLMFGFYIKIEQQYRIDASIDYILQRSPYGVSKVTRSVHGYEYAKPCYSIVSYAGGSIYKVIEMVEQTVLTNSVYGELRDNNNKLKTDWVLNEIYRRYEASELPLGSYADCQPREINEKSLMSRAFRSFIF